MKYKILIILLILIIPTSGCLTNGAGSSDFEENNTEMGEYIMTLPNGDRIYQIRIDEINATCLYGSNRYHGYLDCKYD